MMELVLQRVVRYLDYSVFKMKTDDGECIGLHVLIHNTLTEKMEDEDRVTVDFYFDDGCLSIRLKIGKRFKELRMIEGVSDRKLVSKCSSCVFLCRGKVKSLSEHENSVLFEFKNAVKSSAWEEYVRMNYNVFKAGLRVELFPLVGDVMENLYVEPEVKDEPIDWGWDDDDDEYGGLVV